MHSNTNQQSFPLVSVIIPIYKVEKYVIQCAESLFLQDWPNIEIIFVDNMSPDHSVELVENLLRNTYPECKAYTRIIRQGKQGLGYARDAGLKVASGEYIMHVDSDDWVEPNFVSKMVTKAVETNADIVYCNYFKEYDKGKPFKISKEKDLTGATDRDFIFAIHNGEIQGFMCNKLLRRSLYDLDNLVIPICNMHEDIVFQTQIAYGAKGIVFIAEPLYHYRRRRKGAVTAMSWRQRHLNSAKSLFHLYNMLPKSNSPLDYCEQDLLMRAAWYAISSFDFKLLHNSPDAMKFLAGMKFVKGRRVPIIKQRIVRTYCRIYNLLCNHRQV